MTFPYQSCQQIVRDVQGRQRTARVIADEALSRAEQLQDRFRTFIRLTPDLARKQADRVDAIVGMGRKLPLAGVPFAIKDLIDLRGFPTTCGARVFRDRIAEQDATIVKKLVAVGAVCIGKLNMHECAFGFSGENPTFGDCVNPWDTKRIAGGSSSGSAISVAMNICPVTLGSDTGGSIRLPASYCGVMGFKPTYGRVSRAGVVPLAWSMDHVGPFARTAEDCATILRVIAGPDPADQSTVKQPVGDYVEEIKKPITGLRLGVPGNWFYDGLDPDVAASLQAAIQQLVDLGAERVDCETPLMKEIVGAHRATLFSEAATYHRPYLEATPDLYTTEIRQLLLGGLFLPSGDYLHAQQARRLIRESWAKLFTQIDCLVTPTTPTTAITFDELRTQGPRRTRSYLDFALPLNLLGYPAVSTPCGFSSKGLPIGMQIVGKANDDAGVLRVAHHYQQVTDWHTREPS